MKNQNEILKFEDLLREDHKQQKQNEPKPNRFMTYVTALLVYVLIMFILTSVAAIMLREFAMFRTIYHADEVAMLSVNDDAYGLSFLPEDTYLSYEDAHRVKAIGTYEGFVFFANPANHYLSDFIREDETFDSAKMLELLMTPADQRRWGDNGPRVTIYDVKSLTLPFDLQGPNEEIYGSVVSLNHLGLSITNFIVYLAMLPPLIFLLKADLSEDFLQIKPRKKEWFVLVIVGYLYLIVGNVLATLISNLLSSALQVPITDAANQQVIVDSLRAEGAIFMILSAIFIGPIVEELIFRKAIFGIFKNDRTGLIVSTLLFGTIHLLSEKYIDFAIVNGVSYFIMGAVFGLIYLKNKKNIMIPIAVHILSNAIAVFGVLFIL